jgi:hypothetical protein
VISGYADFDAAVRAPAPRGARLPAQALRRRRSGGRRGPDHGLDPPQGGQRSLAATQTIFSSLDADGIISRVLRVMRSLLRAKPAVLVSEGGGGGRRPRVHRLDGEERVLAAPTAIPPAMLARLLDLRDPVLLDGGAPSDAELVQALTPGRATSSSSPWRSVIAPWVSSARRATPVSAASAKAICGAPR